MLVYFSSAYPAAVKLDGAYFGRCDADAKPIKLEQKETFVEFCPINGAPSSAFILDENSLKKPPSFISVANLKGGYLIRAFRTPDTADFKVLIQQKHDDTTVTVFTEGNLKLTVENSNGVLFYSFPFFSAEVNVEFSGGLAAVFFPERQALYVCDVSGSPMLCGTVSCSSFSFDEILTTTLVNKDIAKHETTCTWKTENGKLTSTSKKVNCSAEFNQDNLPLKILPYAFCEEVCVGGDYSIYLSNDLKPSADKIKEYLGDFIAVCPPPPFRDENEVGLVYKINENVYSVDYLTVTVKEGKIDNIKRSEI
ncbi:MAG: hypothetical protein SPL13_06000 [Clostridia bacterium]|nr:hypothetical protein [Clostridia bacterium]